MRTGMRAAVLLTFLSAAVLPGQAATLFTTTLTSSQEIPPTASSGTGFGSILLNDAQTTITVDESWSGLTSSATASHIHIAPSFGVNGPVVFPFVGVPAAISGSIPEQTFAVTSAQVTALFQGLWYFNVHTSNFPGGEIRGNVLAVSSTPEPASLGLIGLGLLTLGIVRHRRNKA